MRSWPIQRTLLLNSGSHLHGSTALVPWRPCYSKALQWAFSLRWRSLKWQSATSSSAQFKLGVFGDSLGLLPVSIS